MPTELTWCGDCGWPHYPTAECGIPKQPTTGGDRADLPQESARALRTLLTAFPRVSVVQATRKPRWHIALTHEFPLTVPYSDLNDYKRKGDRYLYQCYLLVHEIARSWDIHEHPPLECRALADLLPNSLPPVRIEQSQSRWYTYFILSPDHTDFAYANNLQENYKEKIYRIKKVVSA